TEIPPRVARGGEETGSGVGSDLRGREAEEPRDFLGGIARHCLGAGGLSFLGCLGFDDTLGALRRFAFAAGRALALGETRLERLHEVDDLRLGGFGWLLGDLLAVHLPLDLLLDSGLDGILVLLGLELLRRR